MTVVKPFIFVHQSVSDETESALDALGFVVVRLPSFKALGPYVRCHPDSLLYPLPDGRLLVHSDYYRENRELFDRTGLLFALTDEPVGAEYPRDVLLNALTLGGVLYGKLDSVSDTVKAAYKTHVNVKQGYSRCSVLTLSDRAAVTADRGIARALMSNGVDVLLLPPCGILLRTYGEGEHGTRSEKKPCDDSVRRDGFIGGSGVLFQKGNCILEEPVCGFFGDITAYEHYGQLERFAASHGVRLISLCGSPLEDFGGAVIARPRLLI